MKPLRYVALAVELVASPVRNGFSTRDVIDFELPVFDQSAADFVTVLIGVTPQGRYYGNGRDISQDIAAFNAVIESEAAARDLPCVDLFELSKGMGDDPSLVASDGLHPSAKEYALWERLILVETAKMRGVSRGF